MKLFACLLGALALLVGFAGGLRAYSISADVGPSPVRPVAIPHHPPAQPVRPSIVVRWAPCRPPAHREGKACVTHVTRTVSLPAPPVAAPAAPAPAPAASASQVMGTTHVSSGTSSPHEPGDDGGRHHDEGGGEHEGGDD